MSKHLPSILKLFGILVALCCPPVVPAAEPNAPIPDFLIGEWLVNSVHVPPRHYDTRDQPDVLQNDPIYVGRVFRFTRDEISILPQESACRFKISAQIDSMSVSDLIQRSFGQAPSLQDFGLSIAFEGSQKVIRVRCGDKFLFPGSGSLSNEGADAIFGVWVLQLPDGQLAVRWDREALLILEKFRPSAHQVPSFNCGQAKTESERAICGSPVLALFDLSVTDAYKRMRETGTVGMIHALNASQKRWLAARERCRRDTKCLAEIMFQRLSDIDNLRVSRDESRPWESSY